MSSPTNTSTHKHSLTNRIHTVDIINNDPSVVSMEDISPDISEHTDDHIVEQVVEQVVSRTIDNIVTSVAKDVSNDVANTNTNNTDEDAEDADDDEDEDVEDVEDVEDADDAVQFIKHKVDDGIQTVASHITSNNDILHVVEQVTEPVVDKAFDFLVKRLQIKIGSIEITPHTIMSIVRIAMEVVEASELKGQEQKKMVLRLVTHIIQIAPIRDEQEELCLRMIHNGVVSNTIDIIVDATHGKFEINQIVEQVVDIATNTGCCGLFSLFKK